VIEWRRRCGGKTGTRGNRTAHAFVDGVGYCKPSKIPPGTPMYGAEVRELEPVPAIDIAPNGVPYAQVCGTCRNFFESKGAEFFKQTKRSA
jgi:hypothetical protein